jgi:hypothetical protein
MLGVSGYAWMQHAQIPKGQIGNRAFIAVVATGFAVMGLARAFYTPSSSDD